MSEREQPHGPIEVGGKFKLDRVTYEVTKVGPKMIAARSKKGERWFWRSTLDKAGVQVVAS